MADEEDDAVDHKIVDDDDDDVSQPVSIRDTDDGDSDFLDTEMKTSSSLQLMLSAIADERGRDRNQLYSGDGGFVFVARSSFWTDVFQRFFLEAAPDEQKDDMLFYVHKTAAKSRFNIPHTELEVFRKGSKNQPSLLSTSVDWEETVYLNLILQHLEYYVTCAVCSRTGEHELQILKKFTQKVYASPSKRQMDSKGTSEEISYPNIFFTVDNFEEAFSDIVVRDPEIVCVELVARDRNGSMQGVVFLGSIRYDALKNVYDTRASLSSRMASRMSLGWFKNHKRVEFVRMRGPQGKGHAEMAVSRMKGSGPETPAATPDCENLPGFDVDDEQDQYLHRRMSDPSQSLNKWQHGSLRKHGIRKSQSEAEHVDSGRDGCQEVESDQIDDEFNDELARHNGFFGKSFGQAYHWFKERRRANCVALHAYLTYITLPWYRIIGDVLDGEASESVLTF